MVTTLVFDIETVPDLEGGRRIHGLEGMNDGEVAAAMSTLRLAAKGTDFQPAHLQRIVAISVALRRARVSAAGRWERSPATRPNWCGASSTASKSTGR